MKPEPTDPQIFQYYLINSASFEMFLTRSWLDSARSGVISLDLVEFLASSGEISPNLAEILAKSG